MKTNRVYLIGDRNTIEETIRGVLGFILFLRSIGDVKPIILTTFGIDSPQIEQPPAEIEQQIISVHVNKFTDKNTFVCIMKLFDNDGQCWEEWVIIFDLFNDIQTSIDVNDLNFQIKPDFPLNLNDRDYIKMKLRKNNEKEKLEMFKSQFSSQLNEILCIVDSNKSNVPKCTSIFKLQSIFTEDITKSISELEGKFQNSGSNLNSNPQSIASSKPNSNMNLKLSDESLQFVSKSNTESEVFNRGDEIWNKGYTFFKKMLE